MVLSPVSLAMKPSIWHQGPSGSMLGFGCFRLVPRFSLIIPSLVLFQLFTLSYSPADCFVNQPFLYYLNAFHRIVPSHFLRLGSLVLLSLLLLYPRSFSSSSMSTADTTNNPNNHLSTVTVQPRQADMAKISFSLLHPVT